VARYSLLVIRYKGVSVNVVKYLKQPVTMRLDRDSIQYFKALSEESGIPYQTLVNLYLRDCAANERKLDIAWKQVSNMSIQPVEMAPSNRQFAVKAEAKAALTATVRCAEF